MTDTKPPPPPSKSWSIYSRAEIVAKYHVMDRIGSGAYSDVYKGRRLSDGLIVALKEVHDYHSALREIDALHILQGSPNVLVLHDYFWREDEDAVLVLEFLNTDFVRRMYKREGKEEKFRGVGKRMKKERRSRITIRYVYYSDQI